MIVILLILLVIFMYLWSGLKKLPVGWSGLVLVLGKRTSFKWSEGWICVPWPLGIKAADCRNQIIKLDHLKAITKDGVDVEVDASYVRKIVDLYSYFDVDETTISRGLDDARDQELRHRIRSEEFDTVLDMRDAIANDTRGKIAEKSCKWGIEIPEMLIPAIRPAEKVDEDMQLKKREELQRAGQIVELNHFRDRVNELMKQPPDGAGLSREQAIEQVQMSLGYVKKEAKTQGFSLDPATAAALVQAMKEKK